MLLTLVGLSTLTTHANTTGPHVIFGKITCPQLAQGSSAPSQVVVTVNQNGSPIYTGTAGAEGFKQQMLCTSGDTITVVTSSTAAVDTTSLNGIKAVIGFTNGAS